MHMVRVHPNQYEGALWWAEDDSGFTGGADRLAELVSLIQEWAEAEGVLDDLEIRLVPPTVEAPLPPSIQVSGVSRPSTFGIDAVRVERVLV